MLYIAQNYCQSLDLLVDMNCPLSLLIPFFESAFATQSDFCFLYMEITLRLPINCLNLTGFRKMAFGQLFFVSAGIQ